MNTTENKTAAPPLPQKQEEKTQSTKADIITFRATKTWDSNEIAAKYGYTVHDAARLFAMLDGEGINALADNIKTNGQLVPIATQGKVIVDGRNRLVACEIAGIEPKFSQIGGEPVEAVISLNLQRRNLNESQKATLALRLIPKLKEEAAARKHSGKLNDPGREGGKASELAAKMVGVSSRIIQRLERIERHARHEIVEIEQGNKTVGEVDKGLTERINHVKKYAADEWGKVEKGEKNLDEVFNSAIEKHPKAKQTAPVAKKRNVLIIVSDNSEAIHTLETSLPDEVEGFAFYPDREVEMKNASSYFDALNAYKVKEFTK